MTSYKGFLLATAGGIAGAGGLLSPLAQAADLPMKAAPMPMAIPSANWTGFYIGVHLGGAREQGENRIGGAGYTPDNTTFLGGGQIGHNWQSGNFVYGWEADISGLGSKKTQVTYPSTGYLTYGNHISWLSTFRGRWGLAVTDTMVYMTGGLAVGGVKNTHVQNPGEIYSNSRTRWGWAAGVGIEHMFNRNWTASIETLFVDLGHYEGTATEFCSTCSASSFTGRFSNQAMLARVKANYKW